MNEELIQRGYFTNGKIKGDSFGKFEKFDLGSTNLSQLESVGLIPHIPTTIDFPFKSYVPPKNPKLTKPDSLYCSKEVGTLLLVANKENKKPSEFTTEAKRAIAFEQGLFAGALLGSRVAVITDESTFYYIDVPASLNKKEIVFLPDKLSLNPGLLEEMLRSNRGVVLDPGPLAEKVWQAIWHATKQDPKECLLTFVEIFVLKFLSDNLPSTTLAKSYSFYELSDIDVATFKSKYGKTQIEYYVQNIRPEIKRLFPDKTTVNNQSILDLFGLGTLVSPTSIINGFAFLRSGTNNLDTYNRTFTEILGFFKDFGALSQIDPEFKMRLYETFLKKSNRQQKLGQFFTPRNVVKAIIKMACLENLKDGDLVLDPAAGVGGFVLEPLIEGIGVSENISFSHGSPTQKIKFLGIDVDEIMHILAKANTLLHVAELIRDSTVTVDGLNKLMSEMFVLLNDNALLGTLEYPIKNKASVIMTNPPYVTQGSRIYKDEILKTIGLRNKLDIKDYYDRCGLGLESLFLRYISGALKSGGRAFVIVPYGMLTRSENTMKEKILSECSLIASISLPRNTFFNTTQKNLYLGT
jgi:type I restriction enzyme M protein